MENTRLQDLANREADAIESDESLTDDEKRRYLRDLGEQLAEAEQGAGGY